MRTTRFEPRPLIASRDNDNADLISIETADLPGGNVTTPLAATVNATADAVAYAVAAGTEDRRGAFAGAILGRLAAEAPQTMLDKERATNESLTELAEPLLPAGPVPV